MRNDTNWAQQAYLKASNTGAFDSFSGSDAGNGVALSGDTVVVGAPGESSNATGVNGNQSDNSVYGAGAVYVFTGLGPALPEPPPRIVAILRESNGTMHLRVSSLAGRSYTLQVSGNLIDWPDLTTQTATTNRIEFTDAPGLSPAQRFYRVKQN